MSGISQRLPKLRSQALRPRGRAAAGSDLIVNCLPILTSLLNGMIDT